MASKKSASSKASPKAGNKAGNKAAKKAPAKKAATKKAAAKSSKTATSSSAKTETKKAAAKKTASKKTAAKKAPAKKAPAKKAPAKKATNKTVSSTAKKAAPKKAPKSKFDKKFLDEMEALLHQERAKYVHSAETLKAEADSLMEDREPGDVQFDEESGEGDTLAVERERDLALSAQARHSVDQIDQALARIKDGTYGVCIHSGQGIPKERLRAIPWALERVEYKAMGLGRR